MLYVNLGHRYNQSEVDTLRALADWYEEQGVPEFKERLHFTDRVKLGDKEWDDAHIPLRNALLLQAGAVEFPHASEYYLVSLKGEGGRDKSRRFFRLLSRMMTHSENRKIKAFGPLMGVTKQGMVKLFVKRHPEWVQGIRHTTSCHSPTLEPGCVGCGECSGCFRRWVALYNCGIYEAYSKHPGIWATSRWLLPKEGRVALFKALLTSDPREFLRIALNNWNAYRALRDDGWL